MTPTAFQILRVLADGELHPVARLADALAISRTAVRNAISDLDAAGLHVVRGELRGYRMPHPFSFLDPAAISRFAGNASHSFSIATIDLADSTNSMLMQEAAAGAVSGSVLAAEWQSAGRGRQGRPWLAAIGGSVTCSVLWRFQRGSALAGLSLAAGVAVARALVRLGMSDVALKWPNDVLWHGSKIAGLLIETRAAPSGNIAVVLGIGINVRLPRNIRNDIDQSAADIESACGHPIDRNLVLGVVLGELQPVLRRFAEAGFTPFKSEWERYNAHREAGLSLRLPDGRRLHGVMRGIGPDGVLLFETAEGLQHLHSGELAVAEEHTDLTPSSAPV